MILPSKHLPPQRSHLAVGATVLQVLTHPMSVSRLWEEVKNARGKSSVSRVPFDWFVLAIDLLFIMGIVELKNAKIARKVVA